MSEFWKSNPKKFCDFCKIWIQDNKASINIHESGRNHKEKVNQRLEEIKKKAQQKRNEDKVYNKSMAEIERAAMEAMQNDLSSNPSLRKQYGTACKSSDSIVNSFSSSEEKPSVSKEKKDKKKESTNKQDTNKDSKIAKRKLEKEPEAKIGKWETILVKKPNIETKPGFVDLQLPTKTSTVKKLNIEIDDATHESVKVEEKEKNEPKNKWVPVSFQPVETESQESQESQEQEQIQNEPDKANNQKDEIPIVKSEAVEIKQEEKIPTLKSSSNKKPVVFKKRTKGPQNLREKTDD